jgi:protein-arginine kinase activator protein McsA
VFIEGLSVILPNLHRGIVHTGKVPIKIAQAYARASQLEALQKSLAQAISKEQYENAAHYRDLLHELEKNSPENLEKKASSPKQKINPPIPTNEDDLLL